MNAVAQHTVASILADLKADLFGGLRFDNAAYDAADFADRQRVNRSNAALPESSRELATPKMREEYLTFRLDAYEDKHGLLTWSVGDAEDIAAELRREFLL